MTEIMTNQQEALRSTIEQLLAAICDHPNHANVRLLPSQRKPILIMSCHNNDYGAVLGKAQSMLQAFKLLTRVAGAREGLEVELSLDEKCGLIRGSRRPFQLVDEWDSEPLEKLANLTCSQLLGPCHITLEEVNKSGSRMTVTMLGDEGKYAAQISVEVEKALELIFNSAAMLTGRRLTLELIP